VNNHLPLLVSPTKSPNLTRFLPILAFFAGFFEIQQKFALKHLLPLFTIRFFSINKNCWQYDHDFNYIFSENG